jgi:tricorn protease
MCRCVHKPVLAVTATTLVHMLALPAVQAQRRPHAGMMRYPDVSATQVVFAYRGDLWLAPREGGVAVPLASPPGNEGFPRFSPDGQTVAFVGNYDGNRDLYTIPAQGGVPVRVTHHPAAELLCDWTPDGRLLFSSSGYVEIDREDQLFVVPATGGLPERLPVPYGLFGAISPDGQWLAYTPYTRDFATWKRYRGGCASDIWLFHLRHHTSKRITDWEGTDSQPMWHGDRVYYMSDQGPPYRLNIWVYDTKTGKREQLTHFKDWDVKWPAIGPGPSGGGEIVFQNGADLYLLDLASRQSRKLEITVPGDLPAIRPQRIEVHDRITAAGISATGKRGVFEARGDIWTVPAKKGVLRNLTSTSGVAERDPAWSPDGRWIAHFSDAAGEYDLYLTQSDGKGPTHRLTNLGPGFRYRPTWSPDSKHILYTDNAGGLYLCSLPEKGKEAEQLPVEPKLIVTDPWSRQPQVSWSHDSNWIAYTLYDDNQQSCIWLYNVPAAEHHRVTSGMFYDTWPTFDRKGEYLFFATNRSFESPIYEDIGSTFVYANTDTLAVVPLRAKVGSPWAPESDEESWDKKPKDEEKKKEKGEEKGDDKPKEDESKPDQDTPAKPESGQSGPPSEENQSEQATTEEVKPEKAEKEKKDKDKKEEKPLEIELDGFELRAIPLPVSRGAFYNLAVTDDGKLIYVRGAARGSSDKAAIKLFDLKDEKKKEETVLDDVGGFDLSADGKKLLVRKGSRFAIVDPKPNQKMDDTLPTDGMAAMINPREEWRQLFLEAWRLQRDFFYVPNMHGVDWAAMRDHYIKMLDDCVSRADVGYVIRELISELNIGHAYYFGRDGGDEESVPTGMLGADFELHDGAYRIKDIVQGGPWDFDARGPLSRPGLKLRAGDYLLAVNGVPLDTTKDPWAALQGLKPGTVVTLTVSDKPVLEKKTEEPSPEEATTRETTEEKSSDAGEEAKEAGEGEESDKGKEEEDKEKDPYAGQRDVLVELMSPDKLSDIRYRAWVEKKRAHVEAQTGGRVGYIHVPDTGINGQNELFRQFYGQRHKAALIIDDRWNGGGQIPDRFIELLNRPMTNYWHSRHGRDSVEPNDAHHGPKCMLINGRAGSGGDAFPYYFRKAGLGPLIGTRTWGGLVGISGNPGLIDGTFVTVPTFGFYELDGTWGIEGHGVDPDIEVIDDPALMVNGGDPQLDKAIEVMLAELQRHPYTPPPTPSPPDRSGMGVTKEDK